MRSNLVSLIVILLFIVILDEILAFFVDCVVGEMHEEVILVSCVGFLVFFCCESCEAVFVDEYF